MSEVIKEVADNVILFAKCKPEAIVPTKEEEDAGMDVYAVLDNSYLAIGFGETVKIPTGIKSVFSKRYVVILKERGSTGTVGIAQRSGVIDSGFRGEWLVPITNLNKDKTLVLFKGNIDDEELKQSIAQELELEMQDIVFYSTNKAITQAVIVPVPAVRAVEVTEEEVMSYESKRGEGMLGSSNK